MQVPCQAGMDAKGLCPLLKSRADTDMLGERRAGATLVGWLKRHQQQASPCFASISFLFPFIRWKFHPNNGKTFLL